MVHFYIGVQDRGQQLPPPNFRNPWKFRQMLGKIKNIRADLTENMLNSGYFITILHKNLGKLSNVPWKASALYAYALLYSLLYLFNPLSGSTLPLMSKIVWH
jgi:hypothetical protein